MSEAYKQMMRLYQTQCYQRLSWRRNMYQKFIDRKAPAIILNHQSELVRKADKELQVSFGDAT
jgi:hypothetical protein